MFHKKTRMVPRIVQTGGRGLAQRSDPTQNLAIHNDHLSSSSAQDKGRPLKHHEPTAHPLAFPPEKQHSLSLCTYSAQHTGLRTDLARGHHRDRCVCGCELRYEEGVAGTNDRSPRHVCSPSPESITPNYTVSSASPPVLRCRFCCKHSCWAAACGGWHAQHCRSGSCATTALYGAAGQGRSGRRFRRPRPPRPLTAPQLVSQLHQAVPLRRRRCASERTRQRHRAAGHGAAGSDASTPRPTATRPRARTDRRTARGGGVGAPGGCRPGATKGPPAPRRPCLAGGAPSRCLAQTAAPVARGRGGHVMKGCGAGGGGRSGTPRTAAFPCALPAVCEGGGRATGRRALACRT